MDTASESSTQSKRGRKKLPESIDLRVSKKNATVDVLRNNISYSIKTYNDYIEEINGLRFTLNTIHPDIFSAVTGGLDGPHLRQVIPKTNEEWYTSGTDLGALWEIHTSLINENRKFHRQVSMLREIIESKKSTQTSVDNPSLYLSNSIASHENKNYKVTKASIKIYDICFQGIQNKQSVVETCNLIQQAINELF